MKAFILAAGLGSRLAPLTNDRPKALVDVGGINMLERLIVRLKKAGITKIMINVHHHANLIIDFLQSKEWEGLTIEISDERNKLLDTGGAIKKAENFFKGDENILVHNVDIITEVDFAELQKKHIDSKSLVSLCVRNRESSRGLLFDSQDHLCGWTNNISNEFKWVNKKVENYSKKAYSGVYLASSTFAERIPLSGSFSIIDAWLEMAKTETISAFNDNSTNWFDLGTVERIYDAEKYLEKNMDSQRFLEKVASSLRMISQEELIKTVVILPNKRSVTFLKKYFLSKRVNPIWLPDILSIDEFMEKLSGFSKADPLNLYFDLYNIYKKKEGENAKSAESFLSWAPMIIRDFNDIDLYLSNASDVLKHVSEARAIKEWNLDGQELTSLQKSYINFYQSLFSYYQALKMIMLENASGYTGFIYRHIAENIELLIKKLKWKDYVFVGFNALSPSEEKVFGFIKHNYKTSVFLDADEYYINRQKSIPLQEAGINLNRLIKNWKLPNFNWLTNRLLNDEKRITFHEVQGQVGQVKLAGNLLERRLDGHFGNNNQLINQTALILADENLLLPLLGSLPDKYNNNDVSYNVTLGYPINYSPIKGFIHDWFEILINRQSHKSQQFRTQSIINLFLNNILIAGISKSQNHQLNLIASKFIENKLSYVAYDEVLFIVAKSKDTEELVEILFANVDSVKELLNRLIKLLLFLRKGAESSSENSLILKGQILLLLQISKRLSIALDSSGENLDIRTFSSLFFQLLSGYELSLKGEPLSGIQIMGMLETRALDFKNIILLSANEGILPKAGISDSFIPFDIRHNYGLPLPRDKNTVLSYHFFRLLQYAENIDIIYDASSKGLGIGEPSRFLQQIELELCNLNRKIKLSKTSLSLPSSIKDGEIKVEKNGESIEILRKKAISGFSPSALNTYLSCKLKFYFQYILKLNKENEIEVSVESNTFGKIIHDTLEELYLPFKGKVIDADLLRKSIKDIDIILSKYFSKHYKTKNIKRGKNLLIWEVSKKYIQNFIHSEISELKKKQRKIKDLEQLIEIQLETSSMKVQLKGIIDRVDSDLEGENIRIIDYKTGKVVAKDLILNDIDDFSDNKKYSKAFQIIFYKYLYVKSLNIEADSIEAGIISLRNLSAGFLNFDIKSGTENIIEDFEDLLKSIIDEIFDLKTNFSQTSDTDVCKYCDYKNICNR